MDRPANTSSPDDLNTQAEKIPNGEGKVVDVNGEKVAIYVTPEGVRLTMSAKCSHMGCIVGWDSEKKEWVCPCHGARYSAQGQVLSGPAKQNLEYV